MNHRDTLRAGVEYVRAELARLNELARGDEPLTDEQWRSIEDGTAYVRTTEAELQRYADLDQTATQSTPLPAFAPAVPAVNRADDPFDLSTLSAFATRADVHGRALSAIERSVEVPGPVKEAATLTLQRYDNELGLVARHILVTGSEAYRAAWRKTVTGNADLMTDTERTAMAAARAMSLTTGYGGDAVPFTLDPTIISTQSTTTNPIRRIATVKTTLSDAWNGVTSGGVSAAFAAEGAEVTDGSPTTAPKPINVHKAHAFAFSSIELTQDWASQEAELRAMFAEAKDDLEAIKFTTGAGDGSKEPYGFITRLDGSASEVAPSTLETFAVADLYKVEEALPAKYRLATMDGDTQSNRASWQANRAIYNKVRQFGTSDSHALWERIGAGLPPRLLGYPAYENSAMDGAWNVAATADNHILTLGDFRYYYIVDRLGMTIEFIPHMFGTANNLPTGQRGWYCYWRVGGDVAVIDAFRQLNLATTA